MPKSISLTRGLEALVDDEDFPTLNARKWHAQVDCKGYAYAAHRLPTGEMLLMHRVLTGCLPGELADHANGNTLDNRRVNLRKCSHSEKGRKLQAAQRATNPDRAKGDRNGTRTHPEKVCRGERVASARLTEQDVREIRALPGVNRQIMAGVYGVTPRAIDLVRRRETWKHVP